MTLVRENSLVSIPRNETSVERVWCVYCVFGVPRLLTKETPHLRVEGPHQTPLPVM